MMIRRAVSFTPGLPFATLMAFAKSLSCNQTVAYGTGDDDCEVYLIQRSRTIRDADGIHKGRIMHPRGIDLVDDVNGCCLIHPDRAICDVNDLRKASVQPNCAARNVDDNTPATSTSHFPVGPASLQ